MRWVPYMLNRLTAEGASFKRSWDASYSENLEESDAEPPYALLWYNVETESGELELGIGMRFQPSLSKLDDMLVSNDASCLIEELISLEWMRELQDPELRLHFRLKKDKAFVDVLDAENFPGFKINYAKGIEYDARTVIDEMIAAFLKEYKKLI